MKQISIAVFQIIWNVNKRHVISAKKQLRNFQGKFLGGLNYKSGLRRPESNFPSEASEI